MVKPRTDGLYRTTELKTVEVEGEESRSYWNYLRFYPGNRVISTSTTGTPKQIAEWFVQEKVNETYIPVGEYQAGGRTFSFTLQALAENVDRDGHEYETRVDYTVTIEDEGPNRLQVKTHSHINGNNSTELYEFVSLDEER
jgi:hypothetical protein